ncbi:MAG: complex I subunit 1 family protein [bacterium]
MILTLAKIIVPFFIILNIIPVLIWLERKGSAYIQDRRGPNRASLFGMIRIGGMIHSLTDVVKLLFKEDIMPARVNRFFYLLAPFTAMSVACVTFAVLPFGAPVPWDGKLISLQAADLNAGILYILSIASLGVFGVMLAGWSSNNKYSLLGGLRSSAQMISYEIVMSLAVISILMMSGSLEISKIVENQGSEIWKWNFVRQPLACLLFTVAIFAETNRLPFDLPEGESELVAGYHLEYSSMKFALFFMAEYTNMIIASAVLASLFFGGWQVPFLSTDFLRYHASETLRILLVIGAVIHFLGGLALLSVGKKNVENKKWGDRRDYEPIVLGNISLLIALGIAGVLVYFWPFLLEDKASVIVAAAVQAATFLAKILFFCWVFIWVRWTLPRFRYDQLMNLGWKKMLPLSLVNILATGIAILWT